MAVTKLTLVRTRAGRKPQNVDLDIVREMKDIWTDEDNEDYDPETGLTDGETYTDRQTAQKVAQAYKSYLAKHLKIEVAAVTGTNPDGEGFVFSLNPEGMEESDQNEDVEITPQDDNGTTS